MDANKQVQELIAYHLGQAKFHENKASLLQAYVSDNEYLSQTFFEPKKEQVPTAIATTNDFPLKGTKKKQALFLFNNHGKIQTMREWQSLYMSSKNTDDIKDDVTMTIRLLKIAKTVMKKDYGKNTVKWGLNEWYDYDKDDFKPEYK